MRAARATTGLMALVLLAALDGCALWRRDEVVLLPREDGSTGAITATSGEREVVLDRPYASARRGATGLRPGDSRPDKVQKRFGAALATLPPAATSYVLYFPTGSDDFTEEALATLARLVAEMASRPAPEVTVIGHTDRVGSDEVNDPLSRQRAERVRERLLALGLPADQVVAAGRGSREPLVETADGVAEERNRRVEVSVR